MTSADRDLDEFIERNVSPEVRPQARPGTILATDDEGDAGLRYPDLALQRTPARRD
jgi:hypothetical protein